MSGPREWFDPLLYPENWIDPEYNQANWFDSESIGIVGGDGAIAISVQAARTYRYTRLAPYGATGRFPSNLETLLGADGLIEAISSVSGVGDFSVAAASTVQPSGGFGYGYDRELRRRSAIKAKQRKLDEETAALSQPIDREIGLLLREQEAKDQKRQELERLRELANDLTAEQARRDYGERVAKALDRAIQQANYSALAALDREIQRAQEEEEHAILAVTLLIHESD